MLPWQQLRIWTETMKEGMQYLETLLHWVPRYRIWTRAGCAVPRDTVTPGTKVKNLDQGRVCST